MKILTAGPESSRPSRAGARFGFGAGSATFFAASRPPSLPSRLQVLHPRPQHLGHAQGAGDAAARRVRSVGVEDLGERADARLGQPGPQRLDRRQRLLPARRAVTRTSAVR